MLPEKIKLPKKFDSDELLPPNMDYPYFDRVRHIGFLYEEDDFSLENSCFLAESSLLAYCHPAFVKYAFYYAGLYNYRPFIGPDRLVGDVDAVGRQENVPPVGHRVVFPGQLGVSS